MKSILFLLGIAISVVWAQNWQCPITKGDVDNSKITSDYGPRRAGGGSWFHK
jgi:hypothetical protein